MGSKMKEEAVKSLIRSEYPDILLIEETKMEDKDFLYIGKNLWKKVKGKQSRLEVPQEVWVPSGTQASSQG